MCRRTAEEEARRRRGGGEEEARRRRGGEDGSHRPKQHDGEQIAARAAERIPKALRVEPAVGSEKGGASLIAFLLPDESDESRHRERVKDHIGLATHGSSVGRVRAATTRSSDRKEQRQEGAANRREQRAHGASRTCRRGARTLAQPSRWFEPLRGHTASSSTGSSLSSATVAPTEAASARPASSSANGRLPTVSRCTQRGNRSYRSQKSRNCA